MKRGFLNTGPGPRSRGGGGKVTTISLEEFIKQTGCIPPGITTEPSPTNTIPLEEMQQIIAQTVLQDKQKHHDRIEAQMHRESYNAKQTAFDNMTKSIQTGKKPDKMP